MNPCTTCGGSSCGSTCSVVQAVSSSSGFPGSPSLAGTIGQFNASVTAQQIQQLMQKMSVAPNVTPGLKQIPVIDDDEIPEMTWQNVMEQAWSILCDAQIDYADMGNLSLLVQTHVWLAEEIRVSQEKIPEKVRNLLAAYKNDHSDKGAPQRIEHE